MTTGQVDGFQPQKSRRIPLGRGPASVVFGVAHFLLQLGAYGLTFAMGPDARALGVSLYDVASVLTFPVIYLAERMEWSGIGLAAFFLNSLTWAAAFYLVLNGIARLRSLRR